MLGNLAGHEAMGEEVGTRLEQRVEIGVEVPKLEHLNVTTPEHLVDVAHRNAASAKRCPDAFASRISTLPTLWIECVVQRCDVGEFPIYAGFDRRREVVQCAPVGDDVSLKPPTFAQCRLEQIFARAGGYSVDLRETRT